ncbi:PREDICTED: pikachurin [Nicrophorus vespilloides]|uniref:Pikachurin n=1 Tax=Nicrophorus vespilloides TaxID=110193 RepID=A0ABM1MG33_NICVS|nr:PREDICTED: pikachurin [Nicrophorus vespilloides]
MGPSNDAMGSLAIILILVVSTSAQLEDIVQNQFEAAFQGRCNHGSPCMQLCYDLHDGMYECGCKAGFLLHDDGYSCYEMNSTATPPDSYNMILNNMEDVLYQKDAEFDAELSYENGTELYKLVFNNGTEGTTQGPRLEQKWTEATAEGRIPATAPISTERPCPLDCGPGGGCTIRGSDLEPICLCPLGRGGDRCEKEMEIRSPRFTGSSWLAFPALRGAYKHVQVTLELRPEAYDGIFFLTGERDDMAGDFMALLLHQGFVEFRFDCGSGVGVVRSEETVLLNQWNHITLYRHRWDAWVQLNGGKHVQGRSKGLFSRITFREPLFIGGAGNTTGLSEKLPVSGGLKGCIRHLEVNDHLYKFALDPHGEASKGYGIEECTADRCSRVPCQHGGKCLTSEESAVCLCPLGFSGDLCEIRVDLQVPSFNGSSHLRYKGLGEDALTWLDLEITLKPTAADGLLLYDGHRADGYGDFMAVYLVEGFVEFAYDLGTGAGLARSQHRISLGEWHQIRVSRTGRLAILEVDNQLPVEVMSPGAFTQLSLPQNLYLGGVPNFSAVSPKVRARSAFVGCIQKVVMNGRQVPILAEALGGANVDNCPHPCVARPCGDDGECIPELDYFTCKCRPGYRDQLCSRGPPSFGGVDSYLHFNDPSTLTTLVSDPLDINVRFKVSSSDGLLLWMDSGSGDFLSLGLERGALVLRYTVRAEEIVVVHNSSTVHDNLWHRVRAVRNGGSGVLEVDNGPTLTRQSVDVPQPRAAQEGLFVGGIPDVGLSTGGRYGEGIRGCVADLVLNTDYRLQLVGHEAASRNVGECDL